MTAVIAASFAAAAAAVANLYLVVCIAEILPQDDARADLVGPVPTAA